MKFEQFNKIFNNLTDAEKALWEENNYAYIFSKAEQYLRVGPVIYAKQDYFGMPEDTSPEMLEVLESGCKQIVYEGRGLTPEKAFTGLDVFGFSDLMQLFHFEQEMQSAIIDHGRQEKGILDQIELAHVINGKRITLYNFVE